MQERIMNGFRSKMRNKKENNKGFTLVELIVVIVILAILAALLVPSLVGWIDKAKNEKYAVEARNIYLATQAEISAEYAKSGATAPSEISGANNATMLAAIKATSDLDITSITSIDYATDASGRKYTINQMTVTFESADGKNVTITLKDGSWGKATIN